MNKLQKVILIAGIWYLTVAVVSYAQVFGGPTTLRVPQGGTGFSSTSPNSIIVSGNGSTTPLMATSSAPLWIGSFNATNSALTSTIEGNLTINGT